MIKEDANEKMINAKFSDIINRKITSITLV